jgi:hypothetical protein
MNYNIDRAMPHRQRWEGGASGEEAGGKEDKTIVLLS